MGVNGKARVDTEVLVGREGGADAAVNLDGGGSSTVAVREPGRATATARNSPSDGTERAVANGIGIFVGRH